MSTTHLFQRDAVVSQWCRRVQAGAGSSDGDGAMIAANVDWRRGQSEASGVRSGAVACQLVAAGS